MLWVKLIKAVLKRDDQLYHQRSAYTYRQAQNVNQSESLVTKCAPQGSEEVIIDHNLFYPQAVDRVCSCCTYSLQT